MVNQATISVKLWKINCLLIRQTTPTETSLFLFNFVWLTITIGTELVYLVGEVLEEVMQVVQEGGCTETLFCHGSCHMHPHGSR